jgi:DNA polymerase bacteriophage-type
MQTLGIDIETYSSIDLKGAGVYRYTEAQDFEILMFAYSLNDQPVEIIDLAQGERLPTHILYALTDPNVLKTAHNANFERVCIRKFFKTHLPVDQWECTMVRGTMVGLPGSLEDAGKVLKLQVQKDSVGKALIRYFSIPCKPTKVNGGRTRNLPIHDPEKWNQFKGYCIKDVEVEQGIRNKLLFFDIPKTEKILWRMDQEINDKGIYVDPVLVQNAIKIDKIHKERLTKEAVELTKLENPNSVQQLKDWLTEATGEEITALRKTDIPDLLDRFDQGTIKRVLELRQELSKTSVKKYVALTKALCKDGRVRGLLQFYGASRTGRWAGRIVQPHNLPRNEMEDLDIARNLVRDGDIDSLDILFDSVSDCLSQLIRTAFIATPGSRLIPADFSAIEARVLAWLAGEKWRLNVFNTHGKIYEASASQMFKVPIEQVTKGSVLRQKGKMCELALGYQGGPAAIIRIEIGNNTPKNKRIPENELPKLVKMWRNANPNIVRYWKTVENAALECVETGQAVSIPHGIKFVKEKGILFIELPSKRRLSYLKPQLKPNKFGGMSLFYEGVDQDTKKWGLQQTYGGKLVENIDQAIARDLLGEAMIRLKNANYDIVLHVHDEIVPDMPDGKGSKKEIDAIMGTPIPWAKGLPLKADSYETLYYKKD